MIVDAFFRVVGHGIAQLLGLLPLPSAPSFSGLTAAWSSIWSYGAWANGYVPLTEMCGFAVASLVLWAAWHVERAVMWAYHQVWGSD